MNIAQINMVDFGSTGKIMLQIADTARKNGMQAQTFSTRRQSIRYTKMPPAPEGHHYYGSYPENNLHYVFSRITGKYGFYSRCSTQKLIQELKKFKPDVLHLHNMHSAFLHLPMLLDYVKQNHIPLVWTLHDCWSFTGGCAHFDYEKCEKWKTGCHHCPLLHTYPSSKLDCTRSVWKKKKKMFEGLENLTIVTPSDWLASLVKESFLGSYPVRVINNGIDLSVFRPQASDFRKKYNLENKKIVLGVATPWNYKKGLDIFAALPQQLPEDYQIVLVGTSENTEALLPDGIIAIRRTNNQTELAQIYSAADLFVNPTREDTFPTVNMEALACGTPVLTFKTGGSPEIIDVTCGAIVNCDDVETMKSEIIRIIETRPYTETACLNKAKSFDMYQRFYEYVQLYTECGNH